MNKFILLIKGVLLVAAINSLSFTHAYAQTDIAYPADAGVYNVKNFGATGNGTTDDTAAFQPAIKATLDQSALMVGISDYWSLDSGNAVLKDGIPSGLTAVTIFNDAGTVKAITSTGTWFSWNGSAWTGLTPTLIGGSSMLYLGSTGTLTMDGKPWAIGSTGTITENGVGTGASGEALFDNNGTPEYVSSSGAWYLWSGSAWTQFYRPFMGTANFLCTGAGHSAYQRYGSMVILYVPNGTYLLSNTLQSQDGGTWSSGWLSGLYIQGQSQAATILKLHNNCAGFTSAISPKAVIQTGSENPYNGTTGSGSQAFRHYIRNLTVDVGSGNVGAVGIDFLVNNRGGIYNVTVQSSDSARVGYTGIMMDREYPGPGILKNVTVTGFTTGISLRTQGEYSMTMEHITLNSQVSPGHGLYIDNNTVSINGLTSNNSVPVLYAGASPSHVTLLNGTFTGGASGGTAITSAGPLYCRNITSSGYGTVVGAISGGATPVNVSEYISPATLKGSSFPGDISGSIYLPVEQTPDFNSTTMTQWKNGSTAAPVTDGDFLNSIQTAINAGAPIVYLPRGTFAVSNTIHLKSALQKLVGCNTTLVPTASFPANTPIIQLDGGTSSFIDVQNLSFAGNTIAQNSSQTLAVENCDIGGYSNTSAGTGDTYLEDLISGSVNIARPQYVWARQLNIENQTTNFITNNGGVFWLFGYKTEGTPAMTLLVNQNGSWTELLGGFFYVTSNATATSMILNNGGVFSSNYTMDPYESYGYTDNIQDTEAGVTESALKKSNLSLYSGASETYGAATLSLTGVDVGSVPLAGSSSLSGGVYTVAGSGEISGSTDSLHFVSQSMTGNFDLIARVVTQGNVAAAAKAGVMVRNDSTAGAAYVMIAATPGYGWVRHIRTTAGGGTADWTGGAGSAPLPFWLRLNRTGNLFTAYTSADGVVWTSQGTNSILLNSSVLAGLSVDSSNSQLSTCTFDNVSIEPNP